MVWVVLRRIFGFVVSWSSFFFNDFTVERFLDRIESVLSFTIVDSRTTFFIIFKEDRIGQNI